MEISVSHDSSEPNTVVVAAVPGIQKIQMIKNAATQQQCRWRHPSRLLGNTQTLGSECDDSRGLGALLPGVSSTYCIFDGGVHADIIASVHPKGIPKMKTERADQTDGKTTTTRRRINKGEKKQRV